VIRRCAYEPDNQSGVLTSRVTGWVLCRHPDEGACQQAHNSRHLERYRCAAGISVLPGEGHPSRIPPWLAIVGEVYVVVAPRHRCLCC
jgi:hypothetical protein